jgi:hypothetical protein
MAAPVRPPLALSRRFGHAAHRAIPLPESMMTEPTPAEPIDARTAEPGDWRAAMLAHLRRLILGADPELVEEVKWRKPSNPAGVPTWSRAGIVCTGETYRNYVKLTFAQGAALDDPAGLFNAGFGGGTRRAIDLREGEAIDGAALQALIRAAVAFNLAKKRAKAG